MLTYPHQGHARSRFTLADLDYRLPDELIAQHPLRRRDEARLLIVDRAEESWRDGRITDLPDLLQPNDLLMLNDTEVVPAKLTARRQTGGVVRGLFLCEERAGTWRVMLEGSRRLRVGEVLTAGPNNQQPVTLELATDYGEGQWRVRVTPPAGAEETLDRIGQTPLPPYIRRGMDDLKMDSSDRRRYQTVYARNPGAIAAPTAGLHFTRNLLDVIRARGVESAFVTLHVGVGTFKPIGDHDVLQHVMHSEQYELSPAAADAIRACCDRGGAVVAVGTTTVRALESAGRDTPQGTLGAGRQSTDLFIYPPYDFRVVDALLTNFHLPRSTLLAMVMAFADVELIRRAYRHAVEQRYRFYSYGDAMFIH